MPALPPRWDEPRLQADRQLAMVLLVRHVLICGNHDFVPCFFGLVWQRAIDEPCLPALLSYVHVVTGEVTAKPPQRIVVKQDSHARP